MKKRASMEVGSTTLSSYMDKQTSGLIKRWQKRFFALEGDYLKYYESDKKITMKGAMELVSTSNTHLSCPLTAVILQHLHTIGFACSM